MSNNNHTMRTPLFISADVLAKLVEGSYESLITRVQKLAEEQRATIFGESDDELQIRVSATYSHHAILISTSAVKPIVRIEFAEGVAGSLKLVKHEVVPVPTYDETTRDDYARLEARRAVDAMLAGDVDGATARLQESMRHTVSTSRSATEILYAVTECLRAPSRWRTTVTGAKAAQVKSVLGEQYNALQRGLPTLRYRGVVGASLGDVRASVDAVAARFEAMGRRVQSARQGLASNRSTLTEGARSELATFDAVAEDLARDVQTLRMCARESVRSLDKPENLAQVYDALADALFEFEIATAFIASLVERLAG